MFLMLCFVLFFRFNENLLFHLPNWKSLTKTQTLDSVKEIAHLDFTCYLGFRIGKYSGHLDMVCRIGFL